MTQTTSTVIPGAVTPEDEFFFDLNGYLILRGVIEPSHIDQMNAIIDTFDGLEPPLQHGDWVGGVHAHTFGGDNGMNLQQVYEAGEPFERLINHPGWIEKVKHFIGGQDGFDAHHGPVFIDENFASLRGPGDSIGMHSGGAECCKRTQYLYRNGHYMCGMVNILMALTDIGPGDGGTTVIPGSHKANFNHPDFETYKIGGPVPYMDDAPGSVEVHLKKGDALMFVDSICHGSAIRNNDGLRRIVVYRYGPSWGFFRHPYRPSLPFLERLSPEQREIVMPHKILPRTPNRIADFPAVDTPASVMLTEDQPGL